mgnify:CR=1 FL=1
MVSIENSKFKKPTDYQLHLAVAPTKMNDRYEWFLEKATEMFLTLGFKSVTMDDIASEMGISKKTIYQHFSNKDSLIKATTSNLFERISCGIDEIILANKNPIEELFAIKDALAAWGHNSYDSPFYIACSGCN